ncbi:MAG: hypothetical protein HOZ81_12005, partial [Streptomyces sp.]|nr:hypothetical protein [Streptomyces sp.]
ELDPAPVDAHTPTPRTPATTRPPSSPPASSPPASVPPIPTGAPPSTDAPPPLPTQAQSGSAVPPPAVREAAITRWTGSAGTVLVSADGTGPVRLRVAYTRRIGDGPVDTVRRETRTLRGSTSYTSDVRHEPGNVGCGARAYFGIVVMTEPAAANGPQVSEVVIDGPACATPTPTLTPTPTASRATSEATPATEQPVARPSDAASSGARTPDPPVEPLSAPPDQTTPEQTTPGEPTSDEDVPDEDGQAAAG